MRSDFRLIAAVSLRVTMGVVQVELAPPRTIVPRQTGGTTNTREGAQPVAASVVDQLATLRFRLLVIAHVRPRAVDRELAKTLGRNLVFVIDVDTRGQQLRQIAVLVVNGDQIALGITQHLSREQGVVLQDVVEAGAGDDVRLLDLVEIEAEAQIIGRREHHAEIEAGRQFRFQIGIRLEDARSAHVARAIRLSWIRTRRHTRTLRVSDRGEEGCGTVRDFRQGRRTETARDRGPYQHFLRGLPTQTSLRREGRAEVGVLVVTTGQLRFQALRDRHLQLTVIRPVFALTLGCSAALAQDGTRSQQSIRLVVDRFLTVLKTGGEAQRTCAHLCQLGREGRSGGIHLGGGLARRVDAKLVQLIRCAVRIQEIEGAISSKLFQQIGIDAVLGDLFGLAFRVQVRHIPVPRSRGSLQARHRTIEVGLDFSATRSDSKERVVDIDRRTKRIARVRRWQGRRNDAYAASRRIVSDRGGAPTGRCEALRRLVVAIDHIGICRGISRNLQLA